MRSQHRATAHSPGRTGVRRRRSIREETRPSEGEAIVDHHGVVLWCDRTMRERLDAIGAPHSEPARCCEVLNCAGNTAREESRCLTRLALAAPERLRGRRWKSGRTAATISAKAVYAGAAPIVIFELQFRGGPGGPADERQCATEPDLEVRALGPTLVRVGGRTLDGEWLHLRTGELFRHLLAMRRKPAPTEAIAAALWPTREQAVTNVRYGICKLREQLDAGHAGASLILNADGGYQLDARRLKLDVDDFETRVAAGLELYRSGSRAAAEKLLSSATRMYHGDFLADDPYAEWALTEREYLWRLACEALNANAQIALDEGRLVCATARLARLAELEPFNSEAHQLLIEVCLRRGRRTEALRRYDALRFRLRQTFGEKPDFDLADVTASMRERESKSR